MSRGLGVRPILAQVTLCSGDSGGRVAGIATGYRCNCRLSSSETDEFLDAAFDLLNDETLEPGGTAAAKMSPHDPTAWNSIAPGAVVYMFEGCRQIGVAVVTDVGG